MCLRVTERACSEIVLRGCAVGLGREFVSVGVACGCGCELLEKKLCG